MGYIARNSPSGIGFTNLIAALPKAPPAKTPKVTVESLATHLAVHELKTAEKRLLTTFVSNSIAAIYQTR